MLLKDIFAKITSKTAEVEKQQADITRKLEANKAEKEKAEAAKKEALAKKDESAYKAACRAAADAEAGIEFNTICLKDHQNGRHATDAEDAEIRCGMAQGLKEIYVETINQVENLTKEMINVTEAAINKMKAMDSMMESWDQEITKKHNPMQGSFCQARIITMASLHNPAKGRLNQLQTMKAADPFFKEGGKKNGH